MPRIPGTPEPILVVLEEQALDQDRRRGRGNRPSAGPDPEITDHERMPRVRSDVADSSFLLLAWNPLPGSGRTGTGRGPRSPRIGGTAGCGCRPSGGPVGPLDREHQVRARALRCVEAIAVAVALHRDVAGERVAAVGPPEPRALVLVERQDLVRQRLADERLDGEVAVEDVVDLGAVLEEEPVADATGSRRSRGRPGSSCRGS